MKKLLILFGLGTLLLTSCSSEDAINTDGVLVKKTVKTYGNSDWVVTTNYTYNGKKMVQSSDSDGQYEIYSYTGDLLTQVKHYENLNGNPNYLWETETFTYNSDNKLIQYSQVDWNANGSSVRKEYVYNSDETVSVATYLGSNSSTSYLGRNEIIYFSGGEISAIEFYTAGVLETTRTLTHDTKNYPFKNVTGFNVFELNFPDYSSAFSHNLLSDQDSPEQLYEYTHTYNSLDYPSNTLVSVPDTYVNTQYTYYYE